MRCLRFIPVLLFLVSVCGAQTASNPSGFSLPSDLPTITAFDVSAMDKSVDACTDFYQYACGGWMAKNPVPPDQAIWGRFSQLQERNRDVLHAILEKAAQPDAKRSAVVQKIGDFYASCMDEAKANTLGAKPLQSQLDRIGKIASRAELITTVAYLQSVGVPVLFQFGPSADLHKASLTIGQVNQGGLSLPDRDYYLKDDAKSVETREKYLAHVTKSLELLGDNPRTAAAEAKAVMSIETALAKASMDRVEFRKPENRDHPMTPQQLAQLAPAFDFQRYFVATSAPPLEKVNVTNPEFFKQTSAQLESISLNDWKSYLRWHVVRHASPWLSTPFVTEEFGFYQQYLQGQKEQQARWKRCVRLTDQKLGEALGQPYVDLTFGAEGKQRTLKMVEEIEKAMGEDLQSLSWMTPETRKAAAVKLAGISNKIGYPDKWRDYSKVNVVRGDFLGNLNRADNFERMRQLNKIGKPTDKLEWGMSPPTVNAYYNPPQNNINFPAGILQPPFYDNKMDDAVNFGGIGAVIGHELTHGFDDQGSKYDAVGDLRNWWTEADKAEFEKRTSCISDEYDQFVAVEDVHLKGRLTLGENTADNGGIRLSLMALRNKMAEEKHTPKPIDGFSPEQRFFLSFAQIWCQNVNPAQARLRALTDPHSPGRYRVNGVVSNMPEFQQTWGCKPGQPMVRANACRVW
ncbi:MAG: M13 family metallopeptidase [Acidobacteriia bacterium]|nr:M13 family metallopeptidase [Terriglobia bacterium]